MLDYTKTEVINGDIDYKTVFIPVTITDKKQYQAVSSFIRKEHNWSHHCGHEWDCCGCMCSQRSEIARLQGKTGVLITSNYNC